MEIKKRHLKIGYGALSAVLAAIFLLPAGFAPLENANISEFQTLADFDVFYTAQADDPKTHNIVMSAEHLPDGRLGYKMISHTIEADGDGSIDVTDRYSANPSIPGPTIIIDEGDEVFVQLQNNLGEGCVSIHTHGVHYFPESDGTLQAVNGVEDSCSTTTTPKTFHWSAAKGTAGTWPYHDHTFGSEIGSELEGLYGTLIVNDGKTEALVDGKIKNVKDQDLDKEFVLWMQGTSFYGMEIDHKNGGKQTPLWLNPTIKAKLNDEVRFHVIGIGSEFHTFHIHGHRWLQDGTTNVIDVQEVGPLTKTTFVVKAGEGVGDGRWMYHCHVFAHMEAGMTGIFEVTTTDQPSEPGPSPFDGLVSFVITDEPGPWFRNLNPIPGTTQSLAVASPGDTISFQMTSTNTVHTITSLIYPVATAGGPDATNMPFDQAEAFKGGANVKLEDPGLYVFTCKVHPYMFAAVVVDDPDTTGLDLGENIRIVNGITVPTSSELAVALLKSFFIVTDPNNWQDYTTGLWNVSFPPVDVRLDGGTVINLSALNVVGVPLTAVDPATPGIGEVWINTQFEKTGGKTKWGSATAVDTTTWDVIKKIAFPGINMNHPHNMWTDRDQNVIYQTQWFDNRMAVFDRSTGALIKDIIVGDSPSHVMTRPDATQNIYIAMNGDNSDNSVVEVSPTLLSTTGTIDIGRPHPHGHWMNADVMVTPNAFTSDTTAHEFDTAINTIVNPLGVAAAGPGIPIATGMHPSGEKYYVANLLDQTVTCVSIGPAPKCGPAGSEVNTKPIVLIANWDPITGTQTGPAGLLPIQTPVSPDGKYVVTATLLPSITIIDTTTDELVLSLACDAGCHGVNFGAKSDGGYYAYVSSKFSNALTVFDPEEAIAADAAGDGNGILDSTEAAGVVGKVVLATSNLASGAILDDVVVGLDGMGGQGVLAIPNPYDGWIELTAASTTLSPEVQGWINSMAANGQDDPYP